MRKISNLKFKFFILNFLIFSAFSFYGNTNFYDYSIFSDKISDEEKTVLNSGNVLIRNPHNLSNILFLPSDINSKQVLEELQQIKPVFLAEIIQIIPISSKPDLINNINQALIDIPSYKGIPYYSEHNKIWVDLYSKAHIISEKYADNHHYISAEFYMEPFGDISTDISIVKSKTSLFYSHINTTPVMYNNITCVKPGKMKYIIYVFKTGDNWILYGIGGVNAPKIPFIKNRVELSFMNRIKTFCNFIFQKLFDNN